MQFIDYIAHKLAAFDSSNTHLSKLSRHTTNACHLGTIACGGRYLFEKVMNRFGGAITSEINGFQSFERIFENKALSGLNFKQLTKTFGLVDINPKIYLQLERQLLKDGKESIYKGLKKAEKTLQQHKDKLPSLKYKSQVQETIKNVESQIETIKKFIKDKGLSK